MGIEGKKKGGERDGREMRRRKRKKGDEKEEGERC